MGKADTYNSLAVRQEDCRQAARAGVEGQGMPTMNPEPFRDGGDIKEGRAKGGPSSHALFSLPAKPGLCLALNPPPVARGSVDNLVSLNPLPVRVSQGTWAAIWRVRLEGRPLESTRREFLPDEPSGRGSLCLLLQDVAVTPRDARSPGCRLATTRQTKRPGAARAAAGRSLRCPSRATPEAPASERVAVKPDVFLRV